MGNSKTSSSHMNKQQELLRSVLDLDYLRGISSQDFLNLGVDLVVYIKKYDQDGKDIYKMHAADGAYISSHDNAEIAAMLAVSNDMAPVTLH